MKPGIWREREKRGGGWIELRFVSLLRDTAPLLMLPYLLPPTHYHSVSLSLPPEARTLAPAAWQPLVSFTQLLCCLSHSQHSPSTPPLSATLGWMQQSKRAVCPLFCHYPSLHSPPRLIWLRYNLLPQNVTGIPQLRQEEECCLLLLMASKCCCKGIFGTAQQYPLSQLQRCLYMYIHIYPFFYIIYFV